MKPITKALHTRRVVTRIALVLLNTRTVSADITARRMLDHVLTVLDKSLPESPALKDDLVVACAEAFGEVAGR